MSNLAKVDKIVEQATTLEADDKMILFYKIKDMVVELLEKLGENITMKSAFGLWKNRDIDEKDLRKKAWKQETLLIRHLYFNYFFKREQKHL